ncbi:selenocysteine-specific elongation factor-like protein [Leptotrombidium deliense]|uniref:Selenocysteine-specific elongation factor n=1 Tax=Leptotrombidium deliense TaxID=299467 RepID=A0A443S8U5_9ACAR|nr:selenocysteine-specific elongation factor-like protein [Leptotrombidium deliense]
MFDKVLSLNVGILGHIDSGKTSLAKALSTISSTASFDKNPQSKQRGITIDLGFSCVQLPIPERFKDTGFTSMQLTLVDCPGHASLIRTIIMGAEIIDLMLLIVDVTKGIQTQTAECIVIGEITCDKMIVVLNKVDLIEASKRETTISKISKRILKTLEKTKFSGSSVITVSANPGGGDIHENNNQEKADVSQLLNAFADAAFVPKRDKSGGFLMAVDHCFLIRGQGTVLTGTILQGSVKINDNIEIPSLNIIKKVKSMQMFKKPIDEAIQGDRVGVCVTQFDAKALERGIVSMPGLLKNLYAAIVSVKCVPYFKGACKTKSKFHVSIMHDTVMAKVTFFSAINKLEFSFDNEFQYLDELPEKVENLEENGSDVYALLEFEQPVIANTNSLYIASKLDTDIHANVCRLAFFGNVCAIFGEKNYLESNLQHLKVYKTKSRSGLIERVNNEYEVIVKSLFKKETNIDNFRGLKVTLSTGENGVIDGSFGQSGKCKIRIPDGFSDPRIVQKGKKNETLHQNNISVTLNFKRYIYDKSKKMIQT